MLQLQLVKGTSRDFVLQANAPNGSPAVGLFLGSDTITSRVWRGNDQTTILSPTTVWVSATDGTFQISINDTDTATFEVGQYRIQTLAARAGRTVVVLDAFLVLNLSPGTDTVLVDLVTQDYLQLCLQDMGMTEAQLQLVPQLTKAASRLIRKHCNRWFNRRPSSTGTLSAYDGLYTMDWPSNIVNLRQFPVNGILRVRTNPTQVINVTNTSSSNQQATATLTWTGVQDISDIAPVTTGLRLWSISSGVATTVNLLFATYLTFSSLVTAINAVGNGWSATLADSTYSLWPTADLRQGVGPSVAIGAHSQQGFWVHIDDVPVQIDQEAGIMQIDAGMNDPWSSPRFGTYLDTGLGDLSIGGGLNGLRVMYDAGWDTVPEDVQQACVETVQDMLNTIKLDQRIKSETDGPAAYTLFDKPWYALPPSVQGKLGYYRNIRS